MYASNTASIKRERPRPVARQVSLPAILPKAARPNSPNHSAPCSASGSAGEWDDWFDAFASSRLNSPKGSLPHKQPRTSPTSSQRYSYPPVNHAQELQTCEEEPPPLPPRRLVRTPVNEIYSDGWLHRGQELAVHKEAYLLSQTGVASLQSKRSSISPDPHTSSEISDSLSMNSQPYTNVTSPGFISEEKLKKFKYEPLEDDTDCWGGMLFEQDLYGRACRGNYGQPRVNSHRLSANAEENSGNNFTSVNSGPKMVLEREISVTELLNLPSTTSVTNSSKQDAKVQDMLNDEGLSGNKNSEPKMVLSREISAADLMNFSSTNSTTTSSSKPDATVPEITTTPEEETEFDPPDTPGINNNVSFSLTLGDLNMNVNNSDFSFIDSDGSSQSEVVDTLKGINSFGGTFPQTSEAAVIAAYHSETVTSPQEMFTLKDTYIPEMNSSFEITASSNKLCKVSPVCHDNCRAEDCRCDLNNVAPHGNSRVNRREMAALSPQSGTSVPLDLESRADLTRSVDDFKKTIDDNGNPEGKRGPLDQKETFSGVVSARFRPKGVSRQNSSGSPNHQSRSGDFGEFEQLLSLVQNISRVSEGPLSYQPTKSALSTLMAFNKQADLQGDNTNKEEANYNQSNSLQKSRLTEKCISFEDLHAKVAPNSRTLSESKIGQSLQEPEPSSPSIPCAPSLSADAQSTLHPSPFCCPSLHPSSMGPSVGASSTLAVAPYTSSFSSSTTSTTDQPLVDARHSLLPEETQPASNLPRQESR